MEVRFNPYRIRRYGLSSTQEAKILQYLAVESADRKRLGRIFDLRLVERLVQIGLVAREREGYCLTESGRQMLKALLGEQA